MKKKPNTFVIVVVFLTFLSTSLCHGQSSMTRGVTTVAFTTTDTMGPSGIIHGIPVVPVKVNGYDALFALDTGAPGGMISEDLARQIGVFSQARKQTKQEDPSQGNPPMLDHLSIQIGGCLVIASSFMVKNEQLNSFTRDHIDGVLGRTTLGNMAIMISLPLNTLMIFVPGNISEMDLRPFGFGDLAAIPLQSLSNGHLTTNVSLKQGNMTVSEPLIIDSGSSNTIVSEKAFQELSGKVIKTDRSTTIHGNISEKLFTIDQLSFDSVAVSNPTLAYVQKNNVNFPSVLGRDVLSQYHVLIDMPGLKMYLLPREATFPFQRSRLVPITP